jgi:MSHA biogenesis protein MshI
MRLFGSSRQKPGWMCIHVLPDRVDVSHVQSAGRGRPEVLLCDSYRKEGDDTETLRRLRRELRLERYRCTTLMRNGDYQMLQVEAPNVPDAETRTAVRWRVKDMIDYPVEAATVDALFIPGAGGESTRSAQMLAVAARNDRITATVQPFDEAGIPLEVIDVPELAQRNVAHRFEAPARGLALLAIDQAGGLITFTAGGELYQYRRIEAPLAALASAAEQQNLFERIVLELQRSLDHFDRQFRHIAIAKVLVTPVPGAENLQSHLAASLDVPVELIDLAQALDFPHVPELREPARQAQCLQAIGAALRAEEAA